MGEIVKFDAVFFDLDGTLVNSLADLANSVNYVLRQSGYPTHSTDAYKYFVGDGIAKTIERALPEEHRTNDNILMLKDMFAEHYVVHYADNTVAYDGLIQLVSSLKEKGIKLAVITNKSQDMAEKIIKKIYGNSFDLILGLKEGIPPKPDPTGIMMAMNQLGVESSKCAFVGDSGMDVQGAINAGAYPIGVLWGFREKAELVKFGAKFIASNANELFRAVLSE